MAAIDWEMTPALAFEVFQLKSAEAWRHRGLEQAVYFYLSTWRGENQVYLVRRSLKETEPLAQAPVPPELIAARVAEAAGQDNPRGQLAVGAGIEAWLRAELAAG
ncbi:MAG: hypothetical protein LDL11_06580 [Desulfarculus sp.]|nr:hypothetical protein [Desulfarculus sp.]